MVCACGMCMWYVLKMNTTVKWYVLFLVLITLMGDDRQNERVRTHKILGCIRAYHNVLSLFFSLTR